MTVLSKTEKRRIFMGKREKKRKDPVFLKDAIRRANHEINVLQVRICEGSGCLADENRLCCLMNITLPKLERKLEKRGEDYWIQ
jgi:hypothetical protein